MSNSFFFNLALCLLWSNYTVNRIGSTIKSVDARLHYIFVLVSCAIYSCARLVLSYPRMSERHHDKGVDFDIDSAIALNIERVHIIWVKHHKNSSRDIWRNWAQHIHAYIFYSLCVTQVSTCPTGLHSHNNYINLYAPFNGKLN